jgi:futalosine hydrolase
MILIVTATELEMMPVRRLLSCHGDLQFLVTGVGCLETAAVLGEFLRGSNCAAITMAINFGVAGAFLDTGVGLLDVCMAESEVLGDLGVCFGDDIKPLAEFADPQEIFLDIGVLRRAESALKKAVLSCHIGKFATVNSVSGTAARGNRLRDRLGAICENMEGAAVARICRDFHLPCLELRCVSNLVEDRDKSNWRLDEAIAKGVEALAVILPVA